LLLCLKLMLRKNRDSKKTEIQEGENSILRSERGKWAKSLKKKPSSGVEGTGNAARLKRDRPEWGTGKAVPPVLKAGLLRGKEVLWASTMGGMCGKKGHAIGASGALDKFFLGGKGGN